MAFWSKKDSDDEIRISKEEYEDLKKVEDKWLKLQAAIVTDERLIVLRSEYDQLKKDSTEFSTMQERLTKALEQCQYWERQAKLAKSSADDAQAKAVALEKKYNELYLNIDKHFADREKKLENDRLEAAKQDAADLKELQKRLQKEADDKVKAAQVSAQRTLVSAQKKLEAAEQSRKIAAEQLDKVKQLEISHEALESAYAAREEAVTRREKAVSGQVASAQNVYRIMRERANAARGIVPKKQHDGYLVLSSRQWKERYSAIISGKKTQCSASIWKSVLETPYDVALEADQIRKQIENDLKLIINDIGCHCMVPEVDNGKYKTSMEKIENSREKNVLYKWDLVANFKSSLWLLEIYTTKGLTVPESRRPVQKPRKKQKGAVKRLLLLFLSLCIKFNFDTKYRKTSHFALNFYNKSATLVKKRRHTMRQFFERIKEKCVQKQIEQQQEQELAQKRDLELIEILKKREDPSVSMEEALIAFSAWWEKWLPDEQ